MEKSTGCQSKKRYPIRLSTWIVEDITKKVKKGESASRITIEKIVMCADADSMKDLLRSSVQMSRIYLSLYGKDKYLKYFDEGRLKVVRIIPSDFTMGTGVGNLNGDYEYEEKHRKIQEQKGNSRRR